MLDDIKENAFEGSDLEKERQEMLRRKDSNLMGAYHSYAHLKTGLPLEESLTFEVTEKISEQEFLQKQSVPVDLNSLPSPAEGVQLTADQVDAYIKNILLRAVKNNASDIHIDEMNGLSRVRYRVDGKLILDQSGYVISHGVLSQRFKVMAEFFMREKALIQRGLVTYHIAKDKKIVFTVLVMPTVSGELMVIKMSNSRARLKFNELGFTSEDIRTMATIFEKQSGMIVISGLSGSGRTSTLYALLGKIINKENNVMTIEKKIFERIPGICQMEVGETGEISLKDILKSMNDFDMDVILVDTEIDGDSLRMLLNISLGGRLVIVTSYFPSALDTIVGFTAMGIDPYTIAAALEGIIAQQLVRKSCPDCAKHKKAGKPPNKECNICAGSGYKGKTGIFEIFKMKREYWSLILRKDDSEKLKSMIEKEKCSFENNCKRLINSGVTTVEEILRLGIGKGLLE